MFRSKKRKIQYKNNFRFTTQPNYNQLEESKIQYIKFPNNSGNKSDDSNSLLITTATTSRLNGISFSPLQLGYPVVGNSLRQKLNFEYGKLWTPDLLPLLMWLDASDTSTLTVDGNNNVSEWRDKSNSQGVAVTGDKPSLSTLNGLDVVSFNHEYLYIDIPILTTTHLTFFIVFRHSNKERGMPSFARSPANLGVYYSSDSEYKFYTDSGNSLSYTADDQNFTYSSNYQVLGADTNSHQLTTTGTYRLCIGGDVFSNSGRQMYGEIAEYIIVPKLLNPQDSAIYFGYLHHKWGLQNQLSNNHPYKIEPKKIGNKPYWLLPSIARDIEWQWSVSNTVNKK